MNGARKPHQIAKQVTQHLVPSQEKILVEWVLELTACKNPPTYGRSGDMAIRILKAQSETAPLGKNWVRRFIQRNPEVKSVIASPLESCRVEAASREAISNFYSLFQEVKNKYQIEDQDAWNVDEQGMALGTCSATTVLVPLNAKKAYVKAPQTREWVTVIEAISMNGAKIRPLVIFKGEDLQDTWFEEDNPDFIYTTSANGWTDNKIGLNWLLEIFIPETRPVSGGWRLLLLDGHGSHDNVDFL